MCDSPQSVFEKLRDAQAGGNSVYLTAQDVIDLRRSLGGAFDGLDILRDAEGNRAGVHIFQPNVQAVVALFGDAFDDAEWQHIKEFGTEADRARYAERTALAPK